ncbi:hypothetical protein KEM09_00290 [Carboxylicivirga mesophila]|uniref:Bacteriocin n=1 Tax=Carboxylicivirga mesophila TaxID=1166478 RepID=A0ABS5K5L2_9BACT|nr:hypothetical protein [Carboxylicivirga mesophila]MBS2209821.1 hypothetical protein [Carboxylicivirga mesophila]
MRLAYFNIAFVTLQNTPMDVLAKQFHRGAGHSQHKINYFINLNFVIMKNLNELGVQEMSKKEMKTINAGGLSDLFTVVGVPLAGVGVAVGIATGGVGFALVGAAFAAGALISWANDVGR